MMRYRSSGRDDDKYGWLAPDKVGDDESAAQELL